MVADDGTFSGTSEAVFILGLLQNKLQAPANTNPCQQVYTGILLGQPVAVAISGDPRSSGILISSRYSLPPLNHVSQGAACTCRHRP